MSRSAAINDDDLAAHPVTIKASPQRILLTGAAGFVGFHVTEALLVQGVQVLGIDNLTPYYDPALKQARLDRLAPRNGFSFEQLDIADYDALQGAFARFRPDAVIHLAAQAGVRYSLENPRAYASANLDGFLSVLEACRHHPVQHLIYASSSSVYGANAKVPFSEHDGADHPVSLYAATKRANELMAHSYAHLYSIPVTGLRFFTVYGPWGRPDMAYFSFTKAILEGQPIDVYAESEMSRDFTYVDDVSEAIVRLVGEPPAPSPNFNVASPDPATSAAPYRVYNIGNHTPVRLDRFIAVIEAACGKEAIKRHLPVQPGDVPATYADVSALAARVGFSPSTTIEDGIQRFVDWYRAFYG
ncbi:putative nucleotide sugar epimerase Capsular polysaccharide biosynthesis protein [Bosea sp. LC85]|uniref:NAD-dependent epimerase n=1 Tax=Bosea sp. LC85 TaxID=1502851 RepID=UPI0004E3E0BD|nr:NAD-dependent epimerase [Bosea sp. LC85]KFC66765.1 putative nucleotide sugar epimerase Capsular polysaccharide biosynthesis protein [Bosea sp. LC85]